MKETWEAIFTGKKKNFKNEYLSMMEGGKDTILTNPSTLHALSKTKGFNEIVRTKEEKMRVSDLHEQLSRYIGDKINEIIYWTSEFEELIEEIVGEIYDYADNLNNGLNDYPQEIIDLVDDLDSILDYKNEPEYIYLTKLYYGESYAEWYKEFNNYKGGVCLQNDWSHRVRHACENYEKRINNVVIKGCQYPHRNKPNNCVLRYNYDLKICEPAASYCRAYGIDPAIRTSSNHTVEIEVDKKKKKFTVGTINDCKNNIGQEIAEFIFGTTITRFFKGLQCPMKFECCYNIDCTDKYGSLYYCENNKCKRAASEREAKGKSGIFTLAAFRSKGES